jgi:hypothetical protein
VRSVHRGAVGWAAARSVCADVRHVASRHWLWTSVQGRGIGGRSGAPAFVPGRSAAQLARPGARDVTSGREHAVQTVWQRLTEFSSNFCDKSGPSGE